MSPLMTALLVFLALYVAWMVVANLPRRGRSASYGRADHTGVVLYWRPGCRYCMRLRMGLRFTPLAYTEVNIWRDPEAAAFVRSVNNGNETVPTVTVAGRVLVNPSRRQLLEAAASPGAAS
ncbi:glutaredoxin domain-containing protein [Nonomuraea sp. SBT364]|uniref:glutaredoxin domain-containing protein n=1 Tax=Nonomuraea sp. SBT364 TaxID=1580530 RepID=UPI000A605126|nr:glutaredoxin domain-containing protein [Nonomuraea sp. SBT364]